MNQNQELSESERESRPESQQGSMTEQEAGLIPDSEPGVMYESGRNQAQKIIEEPDSHNQNVKS
jgi:hypothetical protein